MRCPAQLLGLLVLWIPGEEKNKDQGECGGMGVSGDLMMQMYVLSMCEISSLFSMNGLVGFIG